MLLFLLYYFIGFVLSTIMILVDRKYNFLEKDEITIDFMAAVQFWPLGIAGGIAFGLFFLVAMWCEFLQKVSIDIKKIDK